LAAILPIYFTFIFALIEFGHALMVMNALNAVAKDAARFGSYEDVSTANVRSFINGRLTGVLRGRTATILIKNGAALELSSSTASPANVATMTDIELTTAESRQLFIVQIEAPYSSVALMPIRWLNGVTFRGSSVMRKE
jgi:Flp pilus assembly protein TadG